MAYELCIWPEDGVRKPTAQEIVESLAKAGLPCAEQPDQFGHWLVLEGYESALDLTLKDGVATGASFRFATEDDEKVIQKVASVFKSFGWSVSDDEGEDF
jgi:hypothetical protein